MNLKNKALLAGYFSSLEDSKARTRYKEKLDTIERLDPYEIERNEWQDDVDLLSTGTALIAGNSPIFKKRKKRKPNNNLIMI